MITTLEEAVVVFTKQVVVPQECHLEVEDKVDMVVVETVRMDQKILQEIQMIPCLG
tara:strand:+ start:337 stop:504 length:168 start_codon:yes stop_codon:yes gene_type:complete